MKKTALLGIIALAFVAISNPAAWAETEVAALDIPSDFLNAVEWPFTHTESCKPMGKEYHSIAYAKITNDKKVEYVLTTSLDSTIFRYQYAKGGGQPDFVIDFIRTEKRWTRFDLFPGDDTSTELFDKYMIENGVSREDYLLACAKTLRSGFGKFWDELFKKAGAK